LSDQALLLYADDDEDILALVALRLGRKGYEVVTARDGIEALEIARARQPGIAILDVMMPRLGGLAVLEQLRADDELKETKVILLSARAQETDVRRGLDAGADLYLVKPFKFDELESAIAELTG
jgi:DNA-binding response OmpR family regulator